MNGALNYNTFLQLMLVLRRENKGDEVMYANMVFELRRHPEWQKKCRINVAPSDPLIFALEKDKKEKNKGKALKRCCSACSIRQRCLKLTREEVEEDLEMLVAPGLRAPRQGFQFCKKESEAESDENTAEAAAHTPVAEWTRSRRGVAFQAPLRQAVGNDGLVVVKVPFSISDLNNWKTAAGNYQDDPEKVVNAFELMVKIQNPDWQDVDAILQMLFDSTEKDMVRKAARTQIQAQLASGMLQGQVENHFPSADPGWDPNGPKDRQMLAQYQKWVLFGIRNAMPKAINWSKLYEIKQDRKELPTDFLSN